MTSVAALINALRKETGMSISMCKSALELGNGNLDSARVHLLKLAQEKAADLSQSVEDLREGLAGGRFNNGKLTMFKLKCRSDFAAKSNSFSQAAGQILTALEQNEDPGNIVASLSGVVREPVILADMNSVEVNEWESAFTYVHRAVDTNFGSIFAAIVFKNLPREGMSIGNMFAKHVAATAGPIPAGNSFDWLLLQPRFDDESKMIGSSLSVYNATIREVWRLSLK